MPSSGTVCPSCTSSALDAWAVAHDLFVPPCRIDDDGRPARLELDGVDAEDVIRVESFAFGDYG